MREVLILTKEEGEEVKEMRRILDAAGTAP